jgi:hypothetical protein
MKPIITVSCALALLCYAGAASAEGESTPSPSRGERAALEAGSIIGTGVYVPIKGLLCAFGLGTAPLLYVSSGPRAVRDVTNRTCKGTWVITPEVLKGEKPFTFVRDTPCCGSSEP